VAGCQPAPRKLVIFHTNDIHGHFVPEIVKSGSDSVRMGGMVALYDHLDSLRKLYPHSLYLDAGDLMTGNPICNLVYRGVEGGALLEMLNRCGIAAMTIGNHEFDRGAEHLRQFIAAAPYPVINANVEEKSDHRPIAIPTQVFQSNGLKIGVIGLLMNHLAGSVSKSSIEPFTMLDAATTAQKYIDQLDPETDVIVLLTHMGVEEDSLLATQVHHADIIVGGHSHTRLEKPLEVNDVLIVQAGAYCKNLGLLEVTIAADSVSDYTGQLIPLIPSSTPKPSAVKSLADSIDAVIQQQYGQVIGELKSAWNPSYFSGSNVGNWICDRLRARYHADVALVNAGGIRTSVAAGPITMLKILELLPFQNSVVTFNATGRDLEKMANEQARAQALQKHGALEMSGMTIDYTVKNGDAQAIKVTIGDKPLEMERVYRVVSIDYVAMGQWDRYLAFEPDSIETTGGLLSDIIMDEIRASTQPITADAATRLVEVH
ncbi:MAG: bifunctional metallophosphatase/5'-nucleotidase, partial [Calditrichota bacterium]